MIRYLRLPFQYDAARMLEETARIDSSWKLHFNQHDYTGIWSGLSLRAPGGNAQQLVPDTLGQDVPFLDTPLMVHCPYIREVLCSLQCAQTSARLLKLERGAVVKLHKDPELNFEQGEVRLHIPVQTHPEVEFYLDGDRLAMGAGECWYINASLPHRLANPSPADRIHLVVDCVVNDWVRELFARGDLPVMSRMDTTAADRQRRQQIVESLRASGDPVRMALANEMEAEASREEY